MGDVKGIGHWSVKTRDAGWSRYLLDFRTVLVALSLLAAGPLHADCACVCIDGRNRPLCSSVTEIEPLCPPRFCPDQPRRVRPLDSPALPPAGARTCEMQYVYNRHTLRYEWRRLCR